MKYTIFETKWGFCGLAGTENALRRCWLARPGRKAMEARMLECLGDAEFEQGLCRGVQELIRAYCSGRIVDFSTGITVDLGQFSEFARLVLAECRRVAFGRTVSYSQLARRIGRPTASRAAAGALARNPLPLIIPCHRIIRNDGGLGGFSADGGIAVKDRMLAHERRAVSSNLRTPGGRSDARTDPGRTVGA